MEDRLGPHVSKLPGGPNRSVRVWAAEVTTTEQSGLLGQEPTHPIEGEDVVDGHRDDEGHRGPNRPGGYAESGGTDREEGELDHESGAARDRNRRPASSRRVCRNAEDAPDDHESEWSSHDTDPAGGAIQFHPGRDTDGNECRHLEEESKREIPPVPSHASEG